MRKLVAAIVTSGVLLVGGGSSVFAADNHASCNGLGSSTLGPQGLRDDAAHQVNVVADQLGVAPGAVYSAAARQHLGSAAACLAIP